METISFVSVLYEHPYETVKNMIDSIHTYMQYCPYFDYDIILVDNSEKNKFENRDNLNIKLVKSDYNSGYCGGNNIGIGYSNKDYIIVINPDIVITNSLAFDWLIGYTKLYNGIVGKYVGNKDWYVYGATFPTDKQYERGTLPFYFSQPTLNLPGNWKKIPYIEGSLMSFKRSLWKNINYFDESCFPGYFGEAIFQFKSFLSSNTSLIDCPITDFYIHQQNHSNFVTKNIEQWSKDSREYFYYTYAIPNWDKFLEYLI